MNKNYLRKLGEINLKFYPLGLGTASFAGANMLVQKTTNHLMIKKFMN